jgi:hypothetical protein
MDITSGAVREAAQAGRRDVSKRSPSGRGVMGASDGNKQGARPIKGEIGG